MFIGLLGWWGLEFRLSGLGWRVYAWGSILSARGAVTAELGGALN